MKKLFVLLFLIIGIFILIITNTSWLSFTQNDQQVEVTNEIKQIEIDVSGVDTTIIPENRNNVDAEYNGKGKVHIKEVGDSIEVEFESKNWFNFLSWFNKKDVTIYIPEDFDRDLSINSGSGSVNFSGKSNMELKNLSLELSSGTIHLSHIAAENFESEGSSGNMTIDSLSSKTGTFKMSSGNMEINNYSGKLKATVSSGRLSLQMEQLTDNIEINVNSGFANLDLPDNADFSLTGKIGSGSITTNYPLTDATEDKHKMTGVHGSGKYDLKLDVNSGKIEMK